MIWKWWGFEWIKTCPEECQNDMNEEEESNQLKFAIDNDILLVLILLTSLVGLLLGSPHPTTQLRRRRRNRMKPALLVFKHLYDRFYQPTFLDLLCPTTTWLFPAAIIFFTHHRCSFFSAPITSLALLVVWFLHKNIQVAFECSFQPQQQHCNLLWPIMTDLDHTYLLAAINYDICYWFCAWRQDWIHKNDQWQIDKDIFF